MSTYNVMLFIGALADRAQCKYKVYVTAASFPCPQQHARLGPVHSHNTVVYGTSVGNKATLNIQKYQPQQKH